jgi:hypothetical protein
MRLICNETEPRANNQKITDVADAVMFLCHTVLMKVTEHPIGRLMRDRLHYEVREVKEADSRMRELAAAYNEYLDLREQNERRKTRVENLLTVVGPWDWESPDADYAERDAMRLLGIYVSNAEEAEALRSKFPLWRAMQEYLMFVSEARITEMEQFFDHVGYESANRQAMESALKRHPEVFKTRRLRGQKLISLKKGVEA